MNVLITGASSGIGRAFAPLFAADGYDLTLVARNKKALLSLKEELAPYKRKITLVTLDLAKPGSAQKLLSALDEHIDVVVNNAGFGIKEPFIQTDSSTHEQMIELNCATLTHLSQAILAKGGRVINIASTAAFVPGPSMPVYFASKAYVLSLSEALASSYPGHVTCICPGPTASGFQERAQLDVGEEKLPSSKEVAVFGYHAFKKGKRLAIYGVKNKIIVFSVRLLPRTFVATLIKKLF